MKQQSSDFDSEFELLKRIEQLHIDDIPKQFPNLKILTTRTTRLQGLEFLQDLQLVEAELNAEAIQTLSQLKQLKVLTLTRCFGLETWNKLGYLHQLTNLEIDGDARGLNLVRLIRNLPILQFLIINNGQIYTNFVLHTDSRILNVVRARRDDIKLTIRLSKV